MPAPELERDEKLVNCLALDLLLETAFEAWNRGEMTSGEVTRAREIVEQIRNKLKLGIDFDTMIEGEENENRNNEKKYKIF